MQTHTLQTRAVQYLRASRTVIALAAGLAAALTHVKAETPNLNKPLIDGHQPGYIYRPADKGIEIENGVGRFNRPLYSAVERRWRLIAMASDRPEFMLMQISATKNMNKLANIKLGLADGPWLETITPVLARYDRGHQQSIAWAGRKKVSMSPQCGQLDSTGFCCG